MAYAGEPLECGGYVVLEEIGRGTYGQVFKVKRKQNRDDYHREDSTKDKCFALKKIDMKHANKKEKEMLEREISILKDLTAKRHKNIVKYYESFNDLNESACCIVMEYCDGGNLFNFVQKRGKLQEERYVNYLTQLSKAIEFFHDKDILHRDINPNNVFLTNCGKVIKIGDFGVARSHSGTSVRGSYTVVGTPNYLSPEMFKEVPVYDQKVDIWGLGCTCYVMATGHVPFDMCDNITDFKRLDYSGIPYCKAMVELLEAMLQKESPQRPTAKQIREKVEKHECVPDPHDIESNRDFLEEEKGKLETTLCRELNGIEKVGKIEKLLKKAKRKEDFEVSLKELIGQRKCQRLYPVITALREIIDGLDRLPHREDDDLSSMCSSLMSSVSSNMSKTM